MTQSERSLAPVLCGAHHTCFSRFLLKHPVKMPSPSFSSWGVQPAMPFTVTFAVLPLWTLGESQ